jgi:hypothetical protein
MKDKKVILFILAIMMTVGSFATAATSWVVTAGSCEKKICTASSQTTSSNSSK